MKPKRLPIIKFASQKQAEACLREWQTRLFLDTWIIAVCLCDEIIIDDDGTKCGGRNNFQMINKTAAIEISPIPHDEDTRIAKFCHELILVHELLHCKYCWLSAPNTAEGTYYDTLEHQLLEEMARSLIMAKYGIAHDWFVNKGAR